MSAKEGEKQQSSEELFARAVELMPGGVNSPVRAFRGVGGTPRFIADARGATMTDVDGRTYIDYVGSWGPMILGHAAPEVIDALHEALGRGTSYGAPTELEVEMAEEIIDAVPSIEMVRMVNTGTEATMSALRLARGATGREQDRQVRGLLPRPRRQPAREGRLGRGDARTPRQPRRHGLGRREHHHRALQRHGRARTASSTSTAKTSPPSSSSRSSATWAASRRARATCKPCAT